MTRLTKDEIIEKTSLLSFGLAEYPKLQKVFDSLVEHIQALEADNERLEALWMKGE